MGRKFAYILIVAFLLVAACTASGAEFFVPQHWIEGTVNDTAEANAEGRPVRLYFGSDPSNYAESTVGTIGPANQSNKYMINAFSIPGGTVWSPGATLEVKVPIGFDTYGAGPVSLGTTSFGVDAAGDMTLQALGVSIRIHDVEFDGELHNPYPTAINVIRADSLMTAYATVEEEGGYVTTIEVYVDNFLIATITDESWSGRNEISFSYQFTDELNQGPRIIKIRAFSNFSDAYGELDVSVTVAGESETEIIGELLFYPVPFRPLSGEIATFAYNLTMDTDTTLVVYDSSGKVVFTKRFIAGMEGGKLGYNAVTWNGRSDFGYVIGNGIYLYQVISEAEKRSLGTGKIVVFD